MVLLEDLWSALQDFQLPTLSFFDMHYKIPSNHARHVFVGMTNNKGAQLHPFKDLLN